MSDDGPPPSLLLRFNIWEPFFTFLFIPQMQLATLPWYFFLCPPPFTCSKSRPQTDGSAKIVHLLHLNSHLCNPTFTHTASDISITLSWSWQFSSPHSQNSTYLLALILLSAPSTYLHLLLCLPLKLWTTSCTLTRIRQWPSSHVPSGLLPCTFAHAVPMAETGLLFSLCIVLKSYSYLKYQFT